MMEKFRNLSNNIFFKIFLGFLGLTFIMFGVSSFILGNNGSWVAKIDGKKISYSKFIQQYQDNKESIYRANPKPEVLKYLESAQFKQDVTRKMVTEELIKNLQQKYKIYPNRDLILQEITKNPSLQDDDGKFNRVSYQNFLRTNGLTEKEHIEALSREIAGNIIIQSFINNSETNNNLAQDLYKYRLETRNADVITVSTKNIKNIKQPNSFELNEFFEKNKDKFSLPEMRKISYISFGNNDLKNIINISQEEIKKEYENNIDQYRNPELRSFYHILFGDKEEAEEFLISFNAALSKNSPNKGQIFINLSQEQDKDKKAITLDKITKEELPKKISTQAFSLEKHQLSQALESDLGFHIFYLTDTIPSVPIPFKKVKDKIKDKLYSKKQEDALRNYVTDIEDVILASNSLEKISEKFNLKIHKDIDKFDNKGLDSQQNTISKAKQLEGLLRNSFSTKKGVVSKLFYSKPNKKYYTILVEEIEESRKRSLDEVKVLASDMWIKQQTQQKLQELANTISKQINDGKNAHQIAINKGLKIEKNQSFPRQFMVDAGGGRKVPYSNKPLEEIFTLKIGKAGTPHRVSKNEFAIAILKKINIPQKNEDAINSIKDSMKNNFTNDILLEYNKYIQEKFPVEINNKLLQDNNLSQ